MHHNDRRNIGCLARRYLELNVHLSDHDLVRCVRLIGRRHCGIVSDLRDAADEEAALILDHEWFREELLRPIAVLSQHCGASQDKHDET